MQLYFIRHAQSTNNYLFDTTGGEEGRSDDPELTEYGYAQARLLARELSAAHAATPSGRFDTHNVRGFGLTHLYTSPMIRAVLTAQFVAEAVKLPMMMWEDLHESGGVWLADGQGVAIGQSGKNRAYYQRRFPGLVLPDALGERGWWDHRTYESRSERHVRADRVWRAILDRHGRTADRVGLISHGDFFRQFIGRVLNLADLDPYYFMLNNTGITRIDHFENGFDNTALMYLNRVNHLPRELIT